MKKSKILFIVSLCVFLIPQSSFAQTADNSVSVKIGNMIVADRNAGAVQGEVALNYTNDEDHADNKNSSFRGNYYSWKKAQSACTDGWRLPSKNELSLIKNKMQFYEGKAYLEDGDGNRCYFPIAGYSHKDGHNSTRSGYYWSSTPFSSYAFALYFNHNGHSDIRNYQSTRRCSVRCVKTIPES